MITALTSWSLLTSALCRPVPDFANTVLSTAPQVTAEVSIEALDGSLSTRSVIGLRLASLDDLGACVRFSAQPGMRAALEGDTAELQLSTGDRLVAQISGGAGETLELKLAGGARLALSVEELVGLRVEARIPDALAPDVGAPEQGDRLYVRVGAALDRVEGTLVSFTPLGVEFESSTGKRLFAWGTVAALYVEKLAQASKAESREARVVVDLADGGRLRGRFVGLADQVLTLSFPGSGDVCLPLANLALLAPDDGRVAFLSELPVSEELPSRPFGDDLGMVWWHRVDRGVMGGPLMAGGRLYARGLGVHAPSRLTWKLAGAWRELRGSVAVDDSVLQLASRGSVIMRVFVDGKQVFESGILRGGEAPLRMPALGLTGAQELALEVDSSEELHVADRADWLELMLAR